MYMDKYMYLKNGTIQTSPSGKAESYLQAC